MVSAGNTCSRARSDKLHINVCPELTHFVIYSSLITTSECHSRPVPPCRWAHFLCPVQCGFSLAKQRCVGAELGWNIPPRTATHDMDHGEGNFYGSNSEDIYCQQWGLSSKSTAPFLAFASQLPQVGTCDKGTKAVPVLQVGGGDRDNLCPVCGNRCRDSSIFTSSYKLIAITLVFV